MSTPEVEKLNLIYLGWIYGESCWSNKGSSLMGYVLNTDLDIQEIYGPSMTLYPNINIFLPLFGLLPPLRRCI